MQMIAGTDFSRRRRGPFLAPIEILVLAAMVGALLLVLFPGRDFENPKHMVRADDLSMAYLRMLLRAHPEDEEARLLLVQQQVALGRFEEARETLKPLLGRNDQRGAKADIVLLKLDRSRLYSLAPGDPQRAELQAHVQRVAERLLPRTQRAEDLAELADFVLSLGQPAQAARAYQRLAAIDKPNRIGWLEKAGRWSYAAGDPALAAQMYSEGALSAADPVQGARMGRLTLQAMLAANQGRAGLAVVRPIVDRYPRDLGVLESGVRMAVAAGDLATARRWGEQRVQAAGSSDRALREQIDILTKAGDPEGGLRMARTLLARNGGDSALRRQMAQLARWSGQPEESLAQWVWLARRGSEEARKNALDLAQALADVQVEVEMLELRMKRARRMAAPRMPELEMLRKQKPRRAPRVVPLVASWGRRRPLAWPVAGGARARARVVALLPLILAQARPGVASAASPASAASASPAASPAASTAAKARPATASVIGRPRKKSVARAGEFELSELISLADALEAKGLPERAIKAMDDFRFNFAERPEYWVRIARLYENVGELEQALACLEQLSRLAAMTLDDAVRQSKLLWRLLRPDAALTRLIGMRGQARETETEYWRLMGHLAWRVENDLLAAEAFGVLWKSEKTADVAEPLFRSLETLKRSDEAIAVAEEAYQRLGISSFLVSAVDLAVREGRLERAKGLFAQARGKEKQFELETHFWFQRAQLAIGEEKYGQAEDDLQRVLRIDPGSEEAHIEWLTLALQAQDRGMAGRALRHWGPDAAENPDSWGLLADAYALMGEDSRAGHFRRLYREERVRQRLASGRPMTPEEHVEEAIERRDRTALRNGLRLYGTTLSLPLRVGALRELGRDDDAWDLLTTVGLVGDGKSTASAEDRLALTADIRDLRENYLDGIWGWGGVRSLGELEDRNLGARFELRFGSFFVGAEASVTRLLAPKRQGLIAVGDAERRAYLTVRLHESFGETRLRAGMAFLPDGQRPNLELAQRLTLFAERMEFTVRGVYGEVPSHSALLRVASLRDAIEGDLVLAVAGPLEVGAGAGVGRLVTRLNDPLVTEKNARLELAARLVFKSLFLRPRIDAFTNSAPPLNDIPATLAPFLSGQENENDLLALGYSTLGLGVGLGSTQDVGEAKGPHISLRYQMDVWGGYVWPAQRPSYAVDASLGLVFARHQELSVAGFYYSDFQSAVGESFWGGSLNYTVRWFR